MTNNNPTNLEIIKQACVRANPSIAEDPTSLCATGGKQCYEGCTDHYREITLADVLLALNTPLNCDYMVDPSGCFWVWHGDGHPTIVGKGKIQWNLRKPLEFQSEKTINFLAQLLHE